MKPHADDRRDFLRQALPLLIAGSTLQAQRLAMAGPWPDAPMSWVKAIDGRGLTSPLKVGFFIDDMVYLLSPIVWTPTSPDQKKYAEVRVPLGFVTDLTSVPRVFYSLFRPDGRYAQAAVVHDYLYWDQARPREEADDIFRMAMMDLQVDSASYNTLFTAVSLFGAKAWRANANAKAKGERRVLSRLPQEATARWSEWRNDSSALR